MTIAAAFVCCDGIVLAADSEYTCNYSKYEGEKLFQFGNDDWAIGIAVAGTMDLAKMFVDQLHHELMQSNDVESPESIRGQIIALAKYFNAEYIRKSEEQRQLLAFIAIQMKSSDQNLLLKLNGDMVAPVHTSDFIGAGDEIARATASWLSHPSMPVNVGVNIALQVLHWTTKRAQYCGQTIYALMIPKPWRQQRSFTTFEITEFFWGLHELLRPILIGCLNSQIAQDKFDAGLKAFEEKMREVRQASLLAAQPFPGICPSSPAASERQP